MWDAQSVLVRIFQYLLAVLDIILSLFLSTFFIHHVNAGSSAIWLSTAYSASCTGGDSMTSLTWFQVELQSFHFMQTSNPLVVSILLLFTLDIWIKYSPSLICVLSVRKYMMVLNNKNVVHIGRLGKISCLLLCWMSSLFCIHQHIQHSTSLCLVLDCLRLRLFYHLCSDFFLCTIISHLVWCLIFLDKLI